MSSTPVIFRQCTHTTIIKQKKKKKWLIKVSWLTPQPTRASNRNRIRKK